MFVQQEVFPALLFAGNDPLVHQFYEGDEVLRCEVPQTARKQRRDFPLASIATGLVMLLQELHGFGVFVEVTRNRNELPQELSVVEAGVYEKLL